MTSLDLRAERTRALLVVPLFPVTYWGLQHGLRLIDKKATLPPLGLLTLAALLPAHWHLRLVDLNVEELDDADLRWADVVLTGGMLIQVASMLAIIARVHSFRLPVAVGGPAATTGPELFVDADVVFRGEAEGRIQDLVRALIDRRGGHHVLDAPADYPDLASGVTPRFDLLDPSKYASMSLQVSRGCPYRCEFCDITEIFGRRPRVKTSEQVLVELEAIHQLGYQGTVFFVDDNFIGNKAAIKRLLPLLREWQGTHGQPFEFYTEASIDLAADPALVRDLVAAGFTSVFVGIESPSKKALEEANKFQNLGLDLSEAIDRITRAGLEVMGGFIVGFDADGPEVFRAQREFLEHQPIPLAMVGMLTALPGTALWRRLEAEGRLRERSNGDPFSRSNFEPAMGENALIRGYAELMTWLYEPGAYYRRCEAFLKGAGSHETTRSSTPDEVGALLRTLWHVGVLGSYRRHFWRLMVKAALRGRYRLRQAVAHAVQGEHFIRYTREVVVPRLQIALSELRAEALAPVKVAQPGEATPALRPTLARAVSP